MDYSRFKDIADPAETDKETGPERDYYFDSKGNVIRKDGTTKSASAGATAGAGTKKQLNAEQQKKLKEMQDALGNKGVNPFADMKPEEML